MQSARMARACNRLAPMGAKRAGTMERARGRSIRRDFARASIPRSSPATHCRSAWRPSMNKTSDSVPWRTLPICPICRDTDLCTTSPKGRVVACRHIEAGSYRTQTHDGIVSYLHRTGDDLPDQPEVVVENPWPEPMSPDAFCGLVGEITNTILPQSEADPVALLSQILVFFGNALGRTAHFNVEGDTHYLNLFSVL